MQVELRLHLKFNSPCRKTSVDDVSNLKQPDVCVTGKGRPEFAELTVLMVDKAELFTAGLYFDLNSHVVFWDL